MANQKRDNQAKTARQQAQVVVDLFLDVLLSRDRDAGWQGDSLIGKLVDFKGELPKSSGFSGFSKVYEQSKWLREWSDSHKMACIVMRNISDRQCEALCMDRAYRGRTKVAVDPFTPDDRVEIFWSDEACAQQLRCSVKAFQDRVYTGYTRLEELLAEKIAA
ncbi:hypothetical protein NLU14_08660 [Marinobacter sp. 71-i]|uniref:Uncharacterized protein n=1 Tax=Marinobacter iranensis TaxID=2962607 RepID=A0ABT5Y9E4_9GAMM|nr:hypothetical protein [Marinobacter iranensis]MDF0750300.1 hypothetical protein [Marinobacter iranensis]